VNGPPGVECRILRLLDTGTPLVDTGNETRAMPILGIVVPTPPPDGYARILIDRLGKAGRHLRCEPIGDAAMGSARFYYLGWRDKSGDVWMDLAVTLLEEGLVRVGPEPFPEREEYQRHERRAREQELGIWA